MEPLYSGAVVLALPRRAEGEAAQGLCLRAEAAAVTG